MHYSKGGIDAFKRKRTLEIEVEVLEEPANERSQEKEDRSHSREDIAAGISERETSGDRSYQQMLNRNKLSKNPSPNNSSRAANMDLVESFSKTQNEDSALQSRD